MRIIMGILIISFGLWGVAEYFVSGGAENPNQAVVAQVARQDIYGIQLRNSLNRDISQMRQQFGDKFDESQLKEFGLVELRLNQLISDILYQEESADLGLTVTDERKLASVAKNPNFANAQGKFDKNAFKRGLQYQGMSEAYYFKLLEKDLLREDLVRSVLEGIKPPAILNDAVNRYANETRNVTRVKIPTSKFNVGTPTTTQLEESYTQNKSRFMTEEKRTLNYVSFSLEDAVKTATIDPKLVTAHYERNIDEYTSAPKRRFTQVLLDDQDTAQSLYNIFQQTKDLTAALAEVAVDASPAGLGPVEKSGVLAPLQEEAFTLEAGNMTQPQATDFGWMVLIMEEELAPVITPFSDVKADLTQQLTESFAADTFFEKIGQIEEALADNNTAANIGQTFGATVKKSQDTLARNTTLPEVLTTAAFQLQEGETSDLLETEDGTFYIVDVATVQKPTEKPLAAVKAQVTTIWKTLEQFKKATALADDISTRATSTTELTQLVQENSLTTKNLKDVKRQDTDPQDGLTQSALESVFSAPVGEVVVTSDADGIVLFQVTNISIPQTASDENANEQLSFQLSDELILQYNQGLRNKIGVGINKQAVDALF